MEGGRHEVTWLVAAKWRNYPKTNRHDSLPFRAPSGVMPPMFTSENTASDYYRKEYLLLLYGMNGWVVVTCWLWERAPGPRAPLSCTPWWGGCRHPPHGHPPPVQTFTQLNPVIWIQTRVNQEFRIQTRLNMWKKLVCYLGSRSQKRKNCFYLLFQRWFAPWL